MVGHVSCEYGEYDEYRHNDRICVVKTAEIAPEYPSSPCEKDGH